MHPEMGVKRSSAYRTDSQDLTGRGATLAGKRRWPAGGIPPRHLEPGIGFFGQGKLPDHSAVGPGAGEVERLLQDFGLGTALLMPGGGMRIDAAVYREPAVGDHAAVFQE